MEIEILNQEKMDNYNFTKGKWEYLYDGCDHCYDIVSDNSSICSTVSLDRISFDTDKEIEANALLISKSPILLQAIYDSIEPLKKAGLKEMADYHEKIYLESVNL